MIYEWKIPKYPVSAQVAGEELEKIRERNGYVEAADLLEASRAENAPLHSCFEWDDDKAAENYRLYQAKDIIRNIVVKVEKADGGEPSAVRAFVSVTVDKTAAQYQPINIALDNPDYRQIVLMNALTKLEEFRRTYKDFQELSEVFKAIDNFADSLK